MAEDQDLKPIELKSEEVDDILGRVPSWITRNGIMLLLLIVFLLILGSWLFRFPDVKRATITVTSVRPPANVEARTDGKIEKLFVKDNEAVTSGEVLAVIENPADYDDVMELKNLLLHLDIYSGNPLDKKLPVNGDAELGMIQPDYASFSKNYRDYIDFLKLDYHARKIELLEDELDQYRKYSSTLDVQASILNEEYQLSEKQFERDSLLFVQHVMSESNYEESKSGMLAKRNNWHEILSQKAENDIRVSQTEEQILEMELKKKEQTASMINSLEETLNRLKATIATWEKKYLIIAPLDGTVTFTSYWSEYQNVKAGEKVMTVIPDETANLIGKIQLPLRGAGEVKADQQVFIRFENYPYLKYGLVRGKVSNVSKVHDDNFYTVEVALPDGLTTSYGENIEFSQNMVGEAEILTDKMRLIQRIFNPMKYALSRQKSI